MTAAVAAPRLLNVGCGSHLHPDWTNVDVYRSAPGVVVHDIQRGLPFADGTFDACYHSHVLEHLSPSAGASLVRECFRVLRPGGVIRVAVPDLEGIARAYLAVLADASNGVEGAANRYDWITLELFDQMVRSDSGGDMGRMLANDSLDRAFVRERVGAEAERAWSSGRAGNGRGAVGRAVSALVRTSPRRLLMRALRGARDGTVRAAVHEGLFRSSGEVHRWMYDRFSLGRLLGRAGFSDVRTRTARESAIPGFASYGLDVVDGRVRKPDSLFMEATRRG